MTGYEEAHNRTRRRQERELARRHRIRGAVVVAVLVAAVVAFSVGGWLVLRKLRSKPGPKSATYRVTVPEGLTVKQTAERFAAATKGSITAAAFEEAAGSGGYVYGFLEGVPEDSLEGYLFPNTYEVTSLTTPRQAVEMMLRSFARETRDLDWNRAASLGLSRHQAVTTASIIEKEVKFANERPLVASVVYNRLGKNMKLGMCSTVIYALGEWKPRLTEKDTQVDSPYNTYRIDGLPPGPICSPGYESLSAALNPSTTDYLFFLVTSQDGHHSFTADYAQFEKWKADRNGAQ